MSGLVSVIIPVFNRGQMVLEAIESALTQTYRPIEIIAVDDGSTDDTGIVLEAVRARHPEMIRVIRQANSGAGPARNAGLSVAQGEFVQYLDSDDLLAPSKFEKQVAALRQTLDAGVCYCITERCDRQKGNARTWARTAERIESLFPSFLPRRGWATLTPLWRRSVCNQIGPWADFRILEDWEHDLRAGMLGVKPVHLPETLCVVRDHDNSRASGIRAEFTRELTLDFFRAHESVWYHMKQFGLTDWSYVQRFSRTMFLVARMCGSRALVEQAEAALEYTDEMTRLNNQPNATRGFRMARRLLGIRPASVLAESVHDMLKPKSA